MPLTVETVDGVSGADTYVSLADYQSYAAARGWVLRDTDAENEIDLRRAFDAINRNFSYLGEPKSADQAGAWPRTSADGIPANIVIAQQEMAYLIKGGLDPFATIAESTTTSKVKVGPIEESTTTLPTGKPQLQAISGLLRGLLASGGGQVAMVRG